MGWSGCYADQTRQDAINRVLSESSLWDNGTAMVRAETLMKSVRNGTLYRLMRYTMTPKDGSPAMVEGCITVDIFEKGKGSNEQPIWYNKGMTDACYPYYFDAPVTMIAKANELFPVAPKTADCPGAFEWRADVMRMANSRKSLKPGMVVEFKGITPTTFRIESLKPFRGTTREGRVYRLPKKAEFTVLDPVAAGFSVQ